jgi:hypothetical protein
MDGRRRIAETLSAHYDDLLLATTAVPTAENLSPEGRHSRDDYYRQLQACRIVLSLPGAGLDTFRFWENGACNALHLSSTMPLMIPNDFISEIHIKYFGNNVSQLRRQVDTALTDAYVAQEMIIANRQHLVQHHLTTARAAYFIHQSKRAFNLEV